MARLGPGIGVKQVQEAQRFIRHALQDVERVTPPQPDISEMLVANVTECSRDSVEERLGTDEAVVGQHVGAVGKMLARTKPNLEMEGAVLAEQPLSGHLPVVRNLDLRQQTVDQLLLRGAQFMA